MHGERPDCKRRRDRKTHAAWVCQRRNWGEAVPVQAVVVAVGDGAGLGAVLAVVEHKAARRVLQLDDLALTSAWADEGLVRERPAAHHQGQRSAVESQPPYSCTYSAMLASSRLCRG